jgi:hypothetical protein
VLMAGPIVASIVAALEGAVVVGGVSAIGAGLFSLGIPKDVLAFDLALKADKFLLIAHGTEAEVVRAKDILRPSSEGEPVVTSGGPLSASA